MGVKLWSVTIANMIVWVMCALFLSVAAGPLSPSSGTEQNKEVAVDSEAQDSVAVSSRVSSGGIAAILAAANAEPTAIDKSPGYGKRSTDSEDLTVNSREPKALFSSELTDTAVDSEAQDSVAISSRVPSGAIAAILAAANAEPKAIDRSPGYGKRSTDSKDIAVNRREPKTLFSSELTDSAVDSEAQDSVAISSRVPSGAIA